MPTTIHWKISFHPDAAAELEKLDGSVRAQVVKAVHQKLSTDPIGYGDPLGHRAGIQLTGLFSLRATKRQVRVIYFVMEKYVAVLVVSIGQRERFAAHRAAEERVRRLRAATSDELQRLKEMLEENA